MLLDPGLEHLGRGLFSHRAPRDVDRLRGQEEEHEQETQHALHDEEPVGEPPHGVREHYCRSRRNVITPGVTIATNAAASAHAGHTIGRFHSARRSRRNCGSTSMYLPVGRLMPTGFTLWIQPW